MTVRFVIAIVTLAVAFAPATQAAPNAGGADCSETPVSVRPPNAWMGTLSTHWRRSYVFVVRVEADGGRG